MQLAKFIRAFICRQHVWLVPDMALFSGGLAEMKWPGECKHCGAKTEKTGTEWQQLKSETEWVK